MKITANKLKVYDRFKFFKYQSYMTITRISPERSPINGDTMLNVFTACHEFPFYVNPTSAVYKA